MAILNPTAITTSVTPVPDPAPLDREQREAQVAAQDLAARTQALNVDQTSQATLDRYTNSSVIDLSNDYVDERKENLLKNISLGERTVPGVPVGAEKQSLPDAKVSVVDRLGNKMGRDLRVRINVPPKYLTGITAPLTKFNGILFPFTPSINYEIKADYGSVNPTHSNFAVHFYQRSSVSAINITGKFAVQNENDARLYVATIYLLRSISRMRSGGSKTGDIDSGAPPPVCRLNGYGDAMFNNVPVVLQSYRIDLTDNVDYFTVNTNDQGEFGTFDITSVPTLSSIVLTVLPIYSREEMQKFNVTQYLAGGFKGQGFI